MTTSTESPLISLPLRRQDAHLSENQLLPYRRYGVDIIICVHNALEDIKRCLASVMDYATPPYHLIIVDDGSSSATAEFLETQATLHPIELIRNPVAHGYTRSANQGLQRSKARYVILLNSDTVVTPQWVERLVACADSEEKIGMVGPLSNTASWQSIPHFEQNGDWATNPLPLDLTPAQMAQRVAAHSAKIYPQLPFLNGFCLLIKRQLIEEIGYFDETLFEDGYGEENDYCIRARQAGWSLAVADDVYIYHAQSKSYSHERRRQLAEEAGKKLATKYNQAMIDADVKICIHSKAMQGIRLRAKLLIERWSWIAQAQYLWQGKKILFVLPMMEVGGGANVVIFEARALKAMGIAVTILNFLHHQTEFERVYPDLDIPVIYSPTDFGIPDLCETFDVVVATANNTIAWIAPLINRPNPPKLVYYIQDFEPYFYIEKTTQHRFFWYSPWIRRRFASYFFRKNSRFRHAWISYLQIPHICNLTKTVWNQQEVEYQTGKTCTAIGASCDIDVFSPRISRYWDKIRIAVMIRPSSLRRGSRLTMEVLAKIHQQYGDKVELLTFGVAADDPGFLSLKQDFPHHHLGLCQTEEMVSLFNQVDIFADFSHFQAMGLTAMEAMACGVAVIVPQVGGSDTFTEHERNALQVDTFSFQACYAGLVRLIEDTDLRTNLQNQALQDILEFNPEKTAYQMLMAIFGK